MGKVIINVSTMAAHGSMGKTIGLVAYGASKAGGAAAFQAAADCIPAAECFVLNVHPGAVLTSSARENGWNENTIPWDDCELYTLSSPLDLVPKPISSLPLTPTAALAGSFFVWASTKQAKDAALHGRFVWCNWDVDELVAMKPEFEADPGFLRIGLQGVPSLNIMETFAKIAELEKGNEKPGTG
jgi:NAD(P)-dependent dehydrogenase (short-subunit alcohol dehydrogenase family)